MLIEWGSTLIGNHESIESSKFESSVFRFSYFFRCCMFSAQEFKSHFHFRRFNCFSKFNYIWSQLYNFKSFFHFTRRFRSSTVRIQNNIHTTLIHIVCLMIVWCMSKKLACGCVFIDNIMTSYSIHSHINSHNDSLEIDWIYFDRLCLFFPWTLDTYSYQHP